MKHCREQGCDCNKVKITLSDGSKPFSPLYSCAECDNGFSITRSADLLNILKTTYKLSNSYQLGGSGSVIRWDTIKAELDKKIPLIWIVNAGGAHAFVAFEYQEVTVGTSTEKWIHINDPLDKCKGCSYWISFVERTGETFQGYFYLPLYVIVPKL